MGYNDDYVSVLEALADSFSVRRFTVAGTRPVQVAYSSPSRMALRIQNPVNQSTVYFGSNSSLSYISGYALGSRTSGGDPTGEIRELSIPTKGDVWAVCAAPGDVAGIIVVEFVKNTPPTQY